MNQVDQNINKDMCDPDVLDVESLDFSDDQTWLYKLPDDSGERLDVLDWCLSIDWPNYDDDSYQETEDHLNTMLDDILKSQVLSMPDKHKFDSRTYVRPKRRILRPSIQKIVESPPSSNKYLTYNKHNAPLGPILRLKTFNVDTNTDNSQAVKEYAMKRKSLVQEEEVQMGLADKMNAIGYLMDMAVRNMMQHILTIMKLILKAIHRVLGNTDSEIELDDIDLTLMSEGSDRLSSEHVPSKPINIDLSQPAHNIHNTFNKGYTNILNDRGSLNMYQSGESLMRMSPPSLVNSLLMESSGNFNVESMEGKKSFAPRDSGLPTSIGRDSISNMGRESFDPMVTSMTLSILDEKEMNTSFLSQTTHNDNDSLIGTQSPPSLVSSVNSSYIVGNSSKIRDSTDSNIFSSATFTRLEQSERLLTARPRHQMFNSYTKKDHGIWNSQSYTKAREEACQIDATNVLNEIIEKKESSNSNNDMSETITLHYANNKYKHDKDAEKENMDATFEKDDAFYKDMGMHKTMDKQELNEIIQARQKLSLARKTLPTENLPNQIESSPQNKTVVKKSIENASELLARRRASGEKQETSRDVKRNSTFKLASPKPNLMDATVVFNGSDDKNVIDINSATMNLVDLAETTLQQEEWGSQERAMVGSSESTDTGTFSSSSPPESVPDTATEPTLQVASTPLTVRKTAKMDLLNLHTTISPIYDTDDRSYLKSPGNYGHYDSRNTTVINSGTIVKKSSARRDIMNVKSSPEKPPVVTNCQLKSPQGKISLESYSNLAPPQGVIRKTGLPTSKLRQYSSHKDLRLPLSTGGGGGGGGGSMVRRGVFASNPQLSPTTRHAPPAAVAPLRRDSYTIASLQQDRNSRAEVQSSKPTTAPPALVRQGTETLTRQRPLSQLVQPKDLRGAGAVPVSMRNHHMPPPTQRPYSIAGAAQLRVSRPTSVPAAKQSIGAIPVVDRPASSVEHRVSALPRPSRLPAPRRGLRPPSVYSVTSTTDVEHY